MSSRTNYEETFILNYLKGCRDGDPLLTGVRRTLALAGSAGASVAPLRVSRLVSKVTQFIKMVL